jgi:putative hydrolase of the HAD superfamily
MIRGVTFDLWGTLIINSKEYEARLRNKRVDLMHAAVKGKISTEDLVKALKESWTKIQSVRSELRDVPTSHQVDMVQTLLRTDVDLEVPYTEAVLHEFPTLNPYTKKVLDYLNPKTKIGLISNTGRTPGTVLRSVLERMGVLTYFDVTLFSNEVGVLKPHPDIFRQASLTLSVPLSDMLHVGDDVTADIKGAQSAGMHTVLVKEPADLQKVLELV